MANSTQKMKRLESRKSHSWWWDSHISPKNSKWLAENLEEMDQSIKRMLKLIEEDGDTFAKKAEMYYQKRPELVAHVEEFYRMYRSLAERYDNLTGELRKSIPSDLHSQSSGISDYGSELNSPLATPEQRPSRRTSSHRAAGFDFFLGSGGGSSDHSRKENDATSSSSSDSESESDGASSRNKFISPTVNGDGEGMRQRIIELEAEVLEVKEKLQVAEEENFGVVSKVAGNGNYEELLGRITWYDEELKVANERLRTSEEHILRLKAELKSEQGRHLELQERITELEANFSVSVDKIEELEKELRATRSKLESSLEETAKLRLDIENKRTLRANGDAEAYLFSQRHVENGETEIKSEGKIVDYMEKRVMDQELRIKALEDELRTRNHTLRLSEEEIARLKVEIEKNETIVGTTIGLQVELESAQKAIEKKEEELEVEKKQIMNLQEQIRRLEISVSDCDHEIMELKATVLTAENKFTLEKSQLHDKIIAISESQAQLEAELKNWELKAQSLEQEIKRVEAEKTENQELQVICESGMQSEIEQLKADIAKRSSHLEVINKSFDALKLKYDMLMAERDQLNANVLNLTAEVSSRDDRIHQMDEHLHRLHMEHVELISGSKGAQKLIEELKTSMKTLEEEVEKQRIVILDGAEEKREAIRQLCFSIEHYRNGYHQLRQVFLVHKRPAVLAS
ncbi:Networked 4a-like [Thalictrum thalictroides]|uniref:Networked 4a-like n=1 Tax=Thalictrum thalictroides TaxID=46969 RepID=A0A7J6UTA2_THATH|nr:Networked 4a-like [Thalictrum thalictroides]